MAIEIRGVTEEDYPDWMRAVSNGFGNQMTDEEVEEYRAHTELPRAIGARDKGKVVGTAGAYSYELTLPGGVQIPHAAVTAVTVRTTHRRRGVLTSMMRHQLTDVRDRGEAVAGLYASESIIYGRFGYGRATESASFEVETRHGAFQNRADMDGLDIVDGAAASKTIPDVFDRVRRQTPGDVSRTPAWWEYFFKDKKDERGGASARFYAIHETKGAADGYACWRIKNKWDNGLPGSELQLQDVVALNSKAEIALYRLALDVDLIVKVSGRNFPVDHPLRHLLADSRRLRTTNLVDQTWMRLIDVPAALGSRRYETADTLVIEVADDFLGFAAGRFALDASPDGATCKPAKKKADLTIGVADLGAAYLGGGRLGSVGRAARIDEHTPGALLRADRLFRGDPAPFCRTGY